MDKDIEVICKAIEVKTFFQVLSQVSIEITGSSRKSGHQSYQKL